MNEKPGRTTPKIVVAFASLAMGGGLLGGFAFTAVSQTVPAQSAAQVPLRVSGVEIIDNVGNRVAFLGTDDKQNPTLTLFDKRGGKRSALSLSGDGNATLDITGSGGRPVASLGLGAEGRPRLLMFDAHELPRVFLGVVEPDAPDPGWRYNDWVLRLIGDRNDPLATLGMTIGRSGGLVVRDRAGRQWSTPLK